jgi:cysteine desulfurase
MKRIYLDNAATTRVDPEVIRAMLPYLEEDYGNSSSLHRLGRDADRALSRSRETISRRAGARDHRLAFTSGGTESNNFAIKGIAFANRKKGKHIITSSIDHDCVLNSCRWLETLGFRVTYLPVDREGFVSLNELERAITRETTLVSIIHANNEIGTLQDLRGIGEICHGRGVYFHTDACQSFTKTDINLEKQNIDLLTINAHKIYGPKGVGGLFVRQGIRIDPLVHGGGHESGLRSGTVNVPGIVGFAKAVEIMKDRHIRHMARMRDMLIGGALDIRESWLNGPRNHGLCNIANFSFRHIEGESLIVHLDLKGIASSTGSACSSKSLEPSHVLTAIGLKPEEAHGSIRLSLGRDNTREEMEYTLEAMKEAVETLRKISPFKGRGA